jgi:hypothetical protein
MKLIEIRPLPFMGTSDFSPCCTPADVLVRNFQQHIFLNAREPSLTFIYLFCQTLIFKIKKFVKIAGV